MVRTSRSLRRRRALDARERPVEHIGVEEGQRRERLILSRRRDLIVGRERGQKPPDLLLGEIARMPPVVEQDVALDPMDVGLLRPPAVPPLAQRAAHDLEQTKPALGVGGSGQVRQGNAREHDAMSAVGRRSGGPFARAHYRNSRARCVSAPTSSSLNLRPTTEIAAPSFSTRPCTSTNGARFTTSSFGATSGRGTTMFT